LRVNRTQQRESQSLAALEAALRGLPQPRPPENLEAKLLAGIPRIAPAPVSRTRAWWPLAAGLGVAAVALVLAAILFWGDLVDGPQPAPSALGDVSLRHMLPDEVRDHSKETKPCDVLPPLRG